MKLNVSENWSCILSFDELCERSEFVFRFKNLWEGAPILKLREPLETMDLIQISYDYHGIVNGSSGRFHAEFDGKHMEDLSKDIELFIYEFLEKEGATVNGEWNPYKPTPLKY